MPPKLRRSLSDQQLDYLLSRGEISRPQKERVLRALIRRQWTPQLLALAGAAACLVLMVGVVTTWPAQDASFRARGLATPAFQVEAGCGGPCRQGGLLQMRVRGLSEATYLSAYAIAPNGLRIWYFPAEGAPMVRVPASLEPQMLPTGVVLGAEHPPGRYELHLLSFDRPMEQADMLSASPQGHTVNHFEVLP